MFPPTASAAAYSFAVGTYKGTVSQAFRPPASTSNSGQERTYSFNYTRIRAQSFSAIVTLGGKRLTYYRVLLRTQPGGNRNNGPVLY